VDDGERTLDGLPEHVGTGTRKGDHAGGHAADALSAAVAVEWARSRTPRARIRLPDHRTYWAGTDPSPGGLAGAWTAAGPTTTKSVSRNHASPGSRPDGLRKEILLASR
jgi:hypothetical protein